MVKGEGIKQTEFLRYDLETGYLIFVCPDCTFTAGAFPGRRPRVFNHGNRLVQHSFVITPSLLSPDQWTRLGIEPMPVDVQLGIGCADQGVECADQGENSG